MPVLPVDEQKTVPPGKGRNKSGSNQQCKDCSMQVWCNKFLVWYQDHYSYVALTQEVQQIPSLVHCLYEWKL